MNPDRSTRDTSSGESAADGDDPAEPDGSSDRRHPARRASLELQIQNPSGYPDVAAQRLRPWLEELFADLAPEADTATVRFVSDREMRALNRQYRNKDKPTDVLTFPGDLPPRDEALRARADGADSVPMDVPQVAGMPRHLGDVVVSVPTARRQAAEFGHDVARELRLLTLHGALHCLGYDHEVDDGTMERLEDRLRKQWLNGAEAVA